MCVEETKYNKMIKGSDMMIGSNFPKIKTSFGLRAERLGFFLGEGLIFRLKNGLQVVGDGKNR